MAGDPAASDTTFFERLTEWTNKNPFVLFNAAEEIRRTFTQECMLLPGKSGLEKFENHYLFYRNGLHFNTSNNYHPFAPSWGILQSKTIIQLKCMTFSLNFGSRLELDLLYELNPELASIEYWIMGSLNGVSGYAIGGNLALCAVCVGALFLLHRQIILLSAEEGEARMLGVAVGRLRVAVLLTATLAVSCVVSLSGLISFVGLLAPHGARLLTRRSGPGTMLLGGLLGGILLTGADILARSVAAAELPVSIFTSLLGAPFLLFLIVKGRREA